MIVVIPIVVGLSRIRGVVVCSSLCGGIRDTHASAPVVEVCSP